MWLVQGDCNPYLRSSPFSKNLDVVTRRCLTRRCRKLLCPLAPIYRRCRRELGPILVRPERPDRRRIIPGRLDRTLVGLGDGWRDSRRWLFLRG